MKNIILIVALLFFSSNVGAQALAEPGGEAGALSALNGVMTSTQIEAERLFAFFTDEIPSEKFRGRILEVRVSDGNYLFYVVFCTIQELNEVYDVAPVFYVEL